MPHMNHDLATKLENIRLARHGLPSTLARYIQNTAMLVSRHSEDFKSRAELAEYISVLQDLITTKVHSL